MNDSSYYKRFRDAVMREIKNDKEVLRIKMFGNFSMMYGGISLLGKKVSETQFTYLMQILLHNKETGISRERLEELIFGDRDIKNVHHAMQSIIYNAKNKLKKSGLPDANYIKQEKGIFYWTDEIPVVKDTAEFETLCREADETENVDDKLQLIFDACHRYSGEFLAANAGIVWVAAEARRYRKMFYRCVEYAAQILREREDFMQLEKLGRYASGIAPFADWECLTMEALIGMGRYEEAIDLYAATVDMYFQERGIRPSEKMMESLSRLENQMTHPCEMLETIQDKLMEEGEHRGGYMCTYPVFRGIYRMVTRMMERGGQSVYLMLCTIVDSKGNPMKDGEQLDDLSDRLGDAIRRSIRQGDAINRYGKGQYLVLLVNTTYENCSIVKKRINSNFLIGRQRTGVKYHVSPVRCKSVDL